MTTNGEDQKVSFQFTEDKTSIAKIVDGNGNTYQNTFDKDSNLNETIYPDGLTEQYIYDKEGNLQAVHSRSKKETRYSFDQEGNLILRTSPDKTTIYHYYNNGLLKKAVTKESTVEITYDKNKRPQSVIYDNKASLFYEYNSKGQRTSLADSSGLYNVTYHYNDIGKLTKVQQNGHKNILKVDYDGDIIKARTTGDDTRTTVTYGKITNKVETMNTRRPNGDEQTFSYTYDKLGRTKTILESSKNQQQQSLWKLSYDRLSQLTSYTNNQDIDIEITYDRNWNRKAMKTKKQTIQYSSNKMSQMTLLNNDEKLLYDSDGNLVRVENLKESIYEKFHYDDQNKLNGFEVNGESCSYVYDALGHIKEEQCDGIVTDFLVDPFDVFGGSVIGKV